MSSNVTERCSRNGRARVWQLSALLRRNVSASSLRSGARRPRRQARRFSTAMSGAARDSRSICFFRVQSKITMVTGSSARSRRCASCGTQRGRRDLRIHRVASRYPYPLWADSQQAEGPVRRTARVTTESVIPAQAGIHAISQTAPRRRPTSDVFAMLGCGAVGNAENKRTPAFAWIPAYAGMTGWGAGMTGWGAGLTEWGEGLTERPPDVHEASRRRCRR